MREDVIMQRPLSLAWSLHKIIPGEQPYLCSVYVSGAVFIKVAGIYAPRSERYINSVFPTIRSCNFKWMIFKPTSKIDILISWQLPHINATIPQWLSSRIGSGNGLAQWCREATSSYLSQWSSISMSLYGVARYRYIMSFNSLWPPSFCFRVVLNIWFGKTTTVATTNKKALYRSSEQLW